MEKKQEQMVSYDSRQGGKFRWVAVTALLLAIGAILHMVSPSIGGVTPNWTIAMYCLAINLTRPTLGQAFGIGLVSAAINIPTSKAAFPYGNLLSEPVGAVVCALIVHMTMSMTLGRVSVRPAVSAFLSTVASGLVFVTIMKAVLSLPMSVFLFGLLPVVFTVAAVNMIVTQLLYYPAQKLFQARGVSGDGSHNV